MRIRRLRSTRELEQYAENFAHTVRERSRGRMSSTVGLDYLRRCKVRAVFNRQGDMVAGYTIGTGVPFRLLEFVPSDARELIEPPPDWDWDDCCEITCMWRSRGLSSSRMSWVWLHVTADVLTSGKRIVLGHNEHKGLDDLYNRMGAVSLYKGPSTYGHPSRLCAYDRRKVLQRSALFFGLEAPLRFLSRRKR